MILLFSVRATYLRKKKLLIQLRVRVFPDPLSVYVNISLPHPLLWILGRTVGSDYINLLLNPSGKGSSDTFMYFDSVTCVS